MQVMEAGFPGFGGDVRVEWRFTRRNEFFRARRPAIEARTGFRSAIRCRIIHREHRGPIHTARSFIEGRMGVRIRAAGAACRGGEGEEGAVPTPAEKPASCRMMVGRATCLAPRSDSVPTNAVKFGSDAAVGNVCVRNVPFFENPAQENTRLTGGMRGFPDGKSPYAK